MPLTVTVDAARTGPAQGHPNAIPQLQLDDAIRRAESRPGGPGTAGLVILGEPGSGKSTLLRDLFGRVATTGSSAVGFPRDLIPLTMRCDEIPHECWRGGGRGGLAAVVEHVATVLDHRGAGEASISFEPRRPFLFLLDALDEVRDPEQRAQLCAWLSDQLSHDRWHDSRFVITCRQAAWRRERALDNRFLQVTVQGLSEESIRTYVENYFVALDEVFSFDASEQRRTAARERARALLEQVAEPGRMSTDPLRRLTPNPLLLAQLCLVCRNDPSSVPRNRNELHDRCLSALVNMTSSEPGDPTLPATIIAMLQPLAWEMQVLGAEHVWSLDQIVEVLTHVAQRHGVEIAPHAIVERLLACGVLDGDERDHRFAHLSFQEYLAARFACEGPGGPRADHEPLVHALAAMADDPRWDQVILLAVGGGLFAPLIVALAELGTIERHKDLLAECVPLAVPLDEDIVQAVFDRLSLEELGGPRTADVLWSALGTHRPKALEAPASDLVAPPVATVAAAALSDASARPMPASPGSAQNGSGVVRGRNFATPVIATALLWVDGGEFWMGSSAEQGHPAFDQEAAADEGDARRVTVSPFWIAEFPVTNRDYARYLDAQSSGTLGAEPAFWRDSRFNADEQPVVGVSFAAAQSFCDWLSAAFPIADGVFRLPTEAEWEFSARGAELGPERRVARYPWGNTTPTTAEADFGQDMRTGKPAPVGTHPLGRSKSSHAQDLAGGVWEWCLDRWREGYDATAGLRDPCQCGRLESSRVIRGGSWDSGSWRLRSSYRHGLRPTSCHSNVGFRVACGGPRLHLAR